MIAAVSAAALVAVVLSSLRIRPGHRTRDAEPGPGATSTAPSMVPSAGHRGAHRLGRPVPAAGPAEIAAWCDALAREVRSGATVVAALRSVEAPRGAMYDEVRHRLGRGVPLATALQVAPASVDEQAVLTVLAACALHGGGAAEPLDRLANTLRRRAADAAERSVHSAQARLSAIVMTVLPGGVLVLLLSTSGAVRDVARSPLGLAVISLGLGLNLIGWWWMRRLIGGAR